MKLLDKIKDLFLDDVIDDDEIEIEEDEIEKKENKDNKESTKNELPKVMRDTIKREEKVELTVKSQEFKNEDNTNEKKNDNSYKKFNFPIDMENEIPSRNDRKRVSEQLDKNSSYSSKEVKKDTKRDILKEYKRSNNLNTLDFEKESTRKVAELYSRKSEDKNIKPKFKASPVISPVYGILDKNYTKEEVKERLDDNISMKRPSKKVDFETVRKKAFGNLADDIKDNLLCENCELYKEVKKISALSEDDLLYDMTVDDDNEKDVTIEKAYDDYEEFGVAYEPKNESKNNNDVKLNDEELAEESENIKNDSNENESFSSLELKIDKNKVDDEEYTEDLIEQDNKEDLPSRTEKRKEEKVDDDFFELIDSMYKERIDE